MTTDTHFRVNTPTVIHETIDGEVIVANLDEGFYYSIEKLGVVVWNAMVAGASTATISGALTKHFENKPADVEASLVEFFGGLAEQKLIVPVSGSDAEDHTQKAQSLAQALSEIEQALANPKLPAGFSAPSFQKYTDMQQLLLLDPIHEVDETGWPNVVPEKVNN